MNVVKWMRKNNRKIMAFVVIFIMISFVGGYAMQQLLTQLVDPGKHTVWTYRGGQVSEYDLVTARQDLEILQRLQVPIFLRSKQSPLAPDLCAAMLDHVLFAETDQGTELYDRLQQAQAYGQLPLDAETLDRAFAPDSAPGPRYWILLTAEAERAGCVVTRTEAADTLKALIPQMFPGSQGRPALTADQLVRAIIQRDGIPEARILDTFARLLAVLKYARMVTVGQDVTVGQLRAYIARKGQPMFRVPGEQISAEFVNFAVDRFLPQIDEPTEKELQDQLAAFRAVEPGRPGPGNPHGLGYKLPARVQLEYIVLRHSDVRQTVPTPADDEMEQFYRRNKNAQQYAYLFQETLPADPNDPDANTTRTKTYPEVAAQIKTLLHRRKASAKMEMILNEARNLAEAGFLELDPQQATAEQFAARAADYAAIAKQLGDKYDLPIYTGKTGLLRAEDLAGDMTLARLSIQTQSRSPIRLPQLVLAAEGLGQTRLGRFQGRPPVPWANIGPLRDGTADNIQTVAMVRIIKILPPTEPDSIDLSYSIQGVVFEPTDQEKRFNLKDQLVEDVKRIKATPIAQQRAREFIAMIPDSDWDAAVKAYNDKYAKTDGQTTESPLRLESMRDRQRRTSADLEATARLAEINPLAAGWAEQMRRDNTLLDRLVELLGPDRQQADNLKTVLEFPEAWSVYVVKSVQRKPVTRQDYVQAKGITALQLDLQTANALAVVHFTPAEIETRMQFKFARQQDAPGSANQSTDQPSDQNATGDQAAETATNPGSDSQTAAPAPNPGARQ